MKHALLATIALLPLTVFAVDPVTKYEFDTEDTGTSPETISPAVNVAIFGPAGSLAGNSRRLGTGSLRLRPERALATAPEGDDGAVTSNTFDWTASDVRTIAFWMRASAAQGDALATMISLGSSTSNGARFDLRLQTGTTGNPAGASGLLRLEVQGGFVESTAADYAAAGLPFSSLRDDTWHHIAVVIPNATSTVHQALFYIDGLAVAHSTHGTNQGINTGVGPLRIGDSYQDTTRDFRGYIDEVGVYDVALTAQEVLDLYNHGVANASAIAAFEADPEIIGENDPTTLFWTTTGATAISIDQGVGDVTGQTSVGVSPPGTGTQTYVLTVTTATGVETAPLEVSILGPVTLSNPALGPAGFSFTAGNLVPGKAYETVYSFTMEEDSWTLLGAPFDGPASTTLTITDPAASPAVDPKVFYRVRDAGDP